MDTNNHTPRIKEDIESDALHGHVSWSAPKSLWYLFHCLVAIAGGYLFFSFSALIVFLVFTAFTLCLGHSLGMHRRFIHNSYACPIWLEYFFVHLGVLVGMAGPFGMMSQHDLRDWAQRKKDCHPYLRHGKNFWHDGWWQLHCELFLDRPPSFEPEERVRNDFIYRLMERTWMLQQIPWAIFLFYFGGIAWVVWGISARVAVSITGHWLVGYFAHNGTLKHATLKNATSKNRIRKNAAEKNTGVIGNISNTIAESRERDWHIEGAAVQGHNVRWAGLITMGESWHNNHHAFPGSAMLGIYKGQFDPGWWVLNVLMNIGLVWNVKLPSDMPFRRELKKLSSDVQERKLKAPRPCAVLQTLGNL